MFEYLLNYLNVLAFIGNAVVTFGLGVYGFNGLPTNEEQSEKYQTLITPIGYSFWIWAVIFAAQLVFVVVQLLPSFRDNPLITKAIKYDFLALCFSQVAFTLWFTFDIMWLAYICMFAIIYFLGSIVNDQYNFQLETTMQEYWFIKFPFALHFGWILAASLIQLSVLLVSLGATDAVQYYVAIGTLVAMVMIAFFSLFFPTRPEYAVPVPLAWACLGIYLELDTPMDTISESFNGDDISLIQSGALLCAIAIPSLMIVNCVLYNLAVYHCGCGGRPGGSSSTATKQLLDDQDMNYVQYQDEDEKTAQKSDFVEVCTVVKEVDPPAAVAPMKEPMIQPPMTEMKRMTTPVPGIEMGTASLPALADGGTSFASTTSGGSKSEYEV